MRVQIDIAGEVLRRSVACWGDKRATEIVGADQAIVTALQRTACLAASDAPALITGETGTGKELFARAIYLLSSRSSGRFVAVNCAQYQESQLIASELFGPPDQCFVLAGEPFVLPAQGVCPPPVRFDHHGDARDGHRGHENSGAEPLEPRKHDKPRRYAWMRDPRTRFGSSPSYTSFIGQGCPIASSNRYGWSPRCGQL